MNVKGILELLSLLPLVVVFIYLAYKFIKDYSDDGGFE